jgi:flagellar hook-length control protein FliK
MNSISNVSPGSLPAAAGEKGPAKASGQTQEGSAQGAIKTLFSNVVAQLKSAGSKADAPAKKAPEAADAPNLPEHAESAEHTTSTAQQEPARPPQASETATPADAARAAAQAAVEQATREEPMPDSQAETAAEVLQEVKAAMVAAEQTAAAATPASAASTAPAVSAVLGDYASAAAAGKRERTAGSIQASQNSAQATSAQAAAVQSDATANQPRSGTQEQGDMARHRSANGALAALQSLQVMANGQDGATTKESAVFASLSQRAASLTTQAPAAGTGTEFRIDVAQQVTRSEWAPIKVDTQSTQWNRELMATLGDRLTMQINQSVKEATVRLDPPDLGRIELVVRMDGDRLNVQLNASNAGVRDMLAQHAERLRGDLLQQNLQTVDVQVGQQSQRDSDRHQQKRDAVAMNTMAWEAEQDETSDNNNDDRWLSTSA